eukprot:m.29565 g.29565  ORF g.29565 m.29565 type:complete len:86 (+) comp13744_c0_seq4:112-369(+)
MQALISHACRRRVHVGAGSTAAAVLTMLMPPAIDMAIMKQEQRFPTSRVATNILLLIVGCTGFFGGAGTAVLQMAGVNLLHVDDG